MSDLAIAQFDSVMTMLACTREDADAPSHGIAAKRSSSSTRPAMSRTDYALSVVYDDAVRLEFTITPTRGH